VSWEQLGAYIDWFGDKSAEDLQFRREGRTHAEWVEEQPMRIWWREHKDEKIHFRTKMSEYLTADVDALWELTEKVGNALAGRGCDIRKQCTLGSSSTKIWKYSVTEDVPKLQELHDKIWKKTNRGGFCGPLGLMDTELGAKNAQILDLYQTGKIDLEGYRQLTCHIYKVDITSLYPSACSNIEYECAVLPIASKWRILAAKARPEPTAMQSFSAMAESRRRELVIAKPIDKY
jgi:hypothetical protein